MHYAGLTYRPPYEANSLLLQVTSGCSHSACAFCVMYQSVSYRVSPWEEIESDLQEARCWAPLAKRVSNPVPVYGHLPEDKDRLIAQLCEGMAAISKQVLDSHPQKGAEGRLGRIGE